MSRAANIFFSITLLLWTTATYSQSADRGRLDMLMLSGGYSNLVGAGDNFKQKWFSHNLDAALMYDHRMGRSPISIGIGLGISHTRFYTNAAATNVDSTTNDFVIFPEYAEGLDYKRSSFSVNYYEIPAELRFRTKNDSRGHPWKVTIGAKLGFRINSKHTFVDANGYKLSTTRFPNTSRLRGVGLVRIGYGKVSLYGTYQLTPLFHENAGQELYPFTTGVTITLF